LVNGEKRKFPQQPPREAEIFHLFGNSDGSTRAESHHGKRPLAGKGTQREGVVLKREVRIKKRSEEGLGSSIAEDKKRR